MKPSLACLSDYRSAAGVNFAEFRKRLIVSALREGRGGVWGPDYDRGPRWLALALDAGPSRRMIRYADRRPNRVDPSVGRLWFSISALSLRLCDSRIGVGVRGQRLRKPETVTPE